MAMGLTLVRVYKLRSCKWKYSPHCREKAERLLYVPFHISLFCAPNLSLCGKNLTYFIYNILNACLEKQRCLLVGRILNW